jgi:GNAT superfamily N-acetyltransferase
MPSSTLVVVPFTPDMLDLVQGFSCGDQPHERELAEWITRDSIQAMQRGTQVWLYATPERELVGYGSLGVTRWRWPEPTSKKVEIQVIPAVAIQQAYWGKPEGPREERYSSQILDHLLAEADARADAMPLLGLFVHPDNQRAVAVYQRVGFVPFSHTYTDPVSHLVYRSMLRRLR